MELQVGGATFCQNNLEEELEEIKEVGYDFAEIDISEIEPDMGMVKVISHYSDSVPSLAAHLPTLTEDLS